MLLVLVLFGAVEKLLVNVTLLEKPKSIGVLLLLLDLVTPGGSSLFFVD